MTFAHEKADSWWRCGSSGGGGGGGGGARVVREGPRREELDHVQVALAPLLAVEIVARVDFNSALFVVFVRRDALLAHLRERGLETRGWLWLHRRRRRARRARARSAGA